VLTGFRISAGLRQGHPSRRPRMTGLVATALGRGDIRAAFAEVSPQHVEGLLDLLGRRPPGDREVTRLRPVARPRRSLLVEQCPHVAPVI
jgi:hypothetical protein